MKNKFTLTSCAVLALLAPAFSAQAQSVSGLSCTVQAATVWATGYQGEVTVTNNGNSATSGWCVALGFDEAEGVSAIWNASQVDKSSTITICDVGWNGTLTPGQSTSFGFTDTHGGSITLPTCSATPN